MNPTLYDVLGVSRDASRDEIRKAWREAADRFEPGEGGGARQFRLFNEAAEVLLDPERRTAYDASLPAEAPAPEPALGKGTGVVPDLPMPGTSYQVNTAGAGAPSVVQPVGDRRWRPRGRQKTASAGADAAAETDVRRSDPASKAEKPVGGRPVALLAVLGVLAALAVGAGAYFGSRGWAALQEDRQAEQYQEALDRAPAAAESAAAAVLSYDYRSLEADRDAAAKFLTEEYRAEYVDTFDKLVVDSATQTKASVEAEVLASAAMNSADRDPSEVPVLLFVNQTTTSTTSTEPAVALNRVRLDMVEVDGTWLVDGITSY